MNVRIDQLNVVLRERNNFEAMELGMSLVRRQARAAWGAWLLASLPVFALANALAWWHGDAFGWAWLALWWCKPLFERGVLYVLSHDIFGEPVSAWRAITAQRHWGNSGFWGYLGWRRFSPFRTVCLPVNLLEGADALVRAQRRRAVVSVVGGNAMMLVLTCLAFELVLMSGVSGSVFLFTPFEVLSDTWRVVSELVRSSPPWLKFGTNLAWWLAGGLIGPFYVGAGFGLYLNRRTQMEAWDVEISFRRLRDRLLKVSPLLVMVLVAGMSIGLPGHAHAQDTAAPDASASTDEASRPAAPAARRWPANSPQAIFRTSIDTHGFRQAVDRGYEDPLQSPVRTESSWQPRQPLKHGKERPADKLKIQALGALVALVAGSAKVLVWVLVGILVVALLWLLRRWLPWMRGSGRRRRVTDSSTTHDSLVLPEVLPPDVIARARALWAEGMPRKALALLYRASVEKVASLNDMHFPPGTTEGQVLRASRRLVEPLDREAVALMVRTWQHAAYADRLPSDAAFDHLASTLQARFRWSV